MLALLGAGGAPVSSGFTPTDIAGLTLWLKADSLVLSDGDPVGTWEDSSGNGNDATASGTDRPAYKTSIVNGKPVVRFTSANSNKMAAPGTRTQPYTILLVVRETANVANQYVIDGDFGGAASTGIVAFLGSGIGFGGQVSIYCGGSVVSGALTPTNWNAITAIYNTGSSAIYVAGSLVGSGNPGSTNTAGTTIGDTCNSVAAGADTPLDGDIAEILIYDSALGSTDRGNVETYLMTKYGI